MRRTIYDPMSVLRVAWGSRMGMSLIGGKREEKYFSKYLSPH